MTLQKQVRCYVHCTTIAWLSFKAFLSEITIQNNNNKIIPFSSGLTGTDDEDDMMISSRGAIFVSVSTPKAAMEKGKEYNDSVSQGGD